MAAASPSIATSFESGPRVSRRRSAIDAGSGRRAAGPRRWRHLDRGERPRDRAAVLNGNPPAERRRGLLGHVPRRDRGEAAAAEATLDARSTRSPSRRTGSPSVPGVPHRRPGRGRRGIRSRASVRGGRDRSMRLGRSTDDARFERDRRPPGRGSPPAHFEQSVVVDRDEGMIRGFVARNRGSTTRRRQAARPHRRSHESTGGADGEPERDRDRSDGGRRSLPSRGSRGGRIVDAILHDDHPPAARGTAGVTRHRRVLLVLGTWVLLVAAPSSGNDSPIGRFRRCGPGARWWRWTACPPPGRWAKAIRSGSR